MATLPTLWPANIPENLYAVPTSSILADFESERERIFVPDDDEDAIGISIFELGSSTSPPVQAQRFDLGSTEDVTEYSQKWQEGQPCSGTTIIIINQAYSWGQLEVTAAVIQALFTQFKISPGFWPVLKLFGEWKSEDHEVAGGFNEFVTSDMDDSFEFSYTAKHTEKRQYSERASNDPWRVRKIGVDHKYDAATKSNTLVLVNPSVDLVQRIVGLSPDTDVLKLHRLILCAVTERWVWHLQLLETSVNVISIKADLAGSPGVALHRGFDLHYSDSQLIRHLQGKILHVSQMLDLNLSIFENIFESWHFLSTAVQQGDKTKSTKSSILTLSSQTKQWKCQAENLLRKLDCSSLLVRSILDAQGLEALQTSSATTAELASLARDDALKAKKDARTLNTITTLGFIYLPASFVATLLGTQYVTISDNGGGNVSINFAREMWIFVVLTVVLLVGTMGGWLLWERRNRLADLAEVEKARKSV